MAEAEEQLRLAGNISRMGRFQPEAAIASVHVRRAVAADVALLPHVILTLVCSGNLHCSLSDS
jgi:hypothetical protein